MRYITTRLGGWVGYARKAVLLAVKRRVTDFSSATVTNARARHVLTDSARLRSGSRLEVAGAAMSTGDQSTINIQLR